MVGAESSPCRVDRMGEESPTGRRQDGEGDSLRGGKGNDGEGGKSDERKMGFDRREVSDFSRGSGSGD